MKRYAELIRNYKNLKIKNFRDNKLVCDSDYRGEYIVPLHNDTNEYQYVKPRERIAQLILVPYIPMIFEEVNELSDTERGNGGFGSTGK